MVVEPAPQPGADRFRTRLIALIAFVIGVAALRASYPITMPLAMTLIVVAAIWPVKPWLDGKLPSWLSYMLTLLLLVLGLVLFGAAIYFSAAEVVRALFANSAALERSFQELAGWAAEQGIPLDQSGPRRILAFARTALASLYSFVAYLGFIGVLVVLGLPEVPRAYRKLRADLAGPDWREFLETTETVADKIRKYIGVTFLTSCITGLASALWAYLVGLELALTWGVLNFLLNFIPVIGNIVGIIPPALYALAQGGGDVQWTLLVFIGFAVIQLTISNFLYPLLQGRSLALSPVAIVVALAFWAWIWGVAGALIAVPLTAAAAIICDHFDRTRWIARLLSKE